ncbi:hypothetical protein MA16_Dca015332 [Dendrobium catenatum]|uniref:Uncharacterized protein n=1 Tax=Dendrobium catenatum TaxID=906689 RepID=A0A2I0W1C0_9ASPA|nr:hypothetical protein MA16_Dca015332 [Dendrobium catenatum]
MLPSQRALDVTSDPTRKMSSLKQAQKLLQDLLFQNSTTCETGKVEQQRNETGKVEQQRNEENREKETA